MWVGFFGDVHWHSFGVSLNLIPQHQESIRGLDARDSLWPWDSRVKLFPGSLFAIRDVVTVGLKRNKEPDHGHTRPVAEEFQIELAKLLHPITFCFYFEVMAVEIVYVHKSNGVTSGLMVYPSYVHNHVPQESVLVVL